MTPVKTVPPLDGPTFERVRGLVRDTAGIVVGENRRGMVSARLARRLAATGHDDIGGYIDYIDAGARSERAHLVSAMTTNVTQFFREAHHFDRLAGIAARAAATGLPIRAWSAGCSTGQEAYSMAITLSGSGLAPAQVRVLATDIDEAVLRRAMAASYTPRELDSLALSVRGRDVTLADGRPGIPPEIRAMVEFKPLNLVRRWPMRTRFDAIFCRNVAIYFDPATQVQMWRRMISVLKPGGWLFVGHSERLPDSILGDLTPRGQTSYSKGRGPESDGA